MTPDPFVAHCLDLLAGAGPADARRMFGGHGLRIDGLFVGIVVGGRLFLKTDAATRPRFEAAGGEPFSYQRRGRAVSLSFCSPPAEALESAALMAPWVQLALQAARAARRPPSRH